MRRQHGLLVAPTVGCLWSIGAAATAWAHHPIPRTDTGDGWSWFLVWFLGACVFTVIFVATWAAFSFFERRQRAGPDERESSRRLS
jgi:heme/copper-type cytochrome/quinol oxidase subunit 2